MAESKAMVYVHGLMVKSMTDNGRTTKNTELELTLGLMEEFTKATIETIKSMAMVLMSGRMGESTSANGKMTKGMERGHTSSIVSFPKKEFGSKINGLSGCKREQTETETDCIIF